MVHSKSRHDERLVEIPHFASEILGNTRSLFVYLPPDYHENTGRRYAVLYMHDGQHVFSADASGESWDMHVTADRLVAEGRMDGILIVGIATVPDQRLNEYFHEHPNMHLAFKPPFDGDRYEAFVIDEVMPYINRSFRTLTGPGHTAMMGSSAGGIVTYNIGFRRPDVFGQIAVMSPYFVKADFDEEGELREIPFYHRYGTHPKLRVWLDMGGAEGTFMEKYAREEAERLVADGFVPGEDLMLYLHPGAGHSQSDWAARAHAPLLYFFGRIGEAEALQICGDEIVGVKGPDKRINPVVTYTSGFMQSAMRATYTVLDPQLLEVKPDGTLIAKSPGTTRVIVQYGGCTADKEITIVDALPERVNVTVTVKVPASTPPYPSLYAGIEVKPAGDGLYKGSAMIPHGLTFTFKVSHGFGRHERLKPDSGITRRSFVASSDQELYYEVEGWET